MEVSSTALHHLILGGALAFLFLFQAELLSLEREILKRFASDQYSYIGHILTSLVVVTFLMLLFHFSSWIDTWMPYKEKADRPERYSPEELEAAIARYEPPEEPADTKQITPFPTVWLWIVILYGTLSFAVIGFGVLFWSL